MRLDGHDRAVALAAAGEENDMPGSFQVSPYCGGLTPKLGHADILGYDLEIQLARLMYAYLHYFFSLKNIGAQIGHLHFTDFV